MGEEPQEFQQGEQELHLEQELQQGQEEELVF